MNASFYFSLDNLNMKKDKNNKILEALIIFFWHLKKIQQSYVFGSATWRLILNKFDPEKNDIDLLLPMINMKKILILLQIIMDEYNIPYNIEPKLMEDRTIYPNARSSKYKIITFKLTINDELKFDFIFCDNPQIFIESLSDIDSGMLVYNINIDLTYVGGHARLHRYPEVILDNVEKMHLTTYHLQRNMKNIQTSMERIMKMITLHNFKIVDSATKRIIFYIIMSALHMNYFYFKKSVLKCKRYKYNCCTCNNANLFKLSKLLTIENYEFAKQLMKELIETSEARNYTLDVMIKYALNMCDYDYAIYLLDFLYKASSDRINFTYIIPFLRKLNNFEYITKFISKLIEHNILKCVICFSCELPAVSMKRAFIIDAIYSNDISYYFKLVQMNPILDVNLSELKEFSNIRFYINNFVKRVIYILLKKKRKYLSKPALDLIYDYLGPI
jgi:hypothetical protein